MQLNFPLQATTNASVNSFHSCPWKERAGWTLGSVLSKQTHLDHQSTPVVWSGTWIAAHMWLAGAQVPCDSWGANISGCFYGPVCSDISNLILPHIPSFHLESEGPVPPAAAELLQLSISVNADPTPIPGPSWEIIMCSLPYGTTPNFPLPCTHNQEGQSQWLPVGSVGLGMVGYSCLGSTAFLGPELSLVNTPMIWAFESHPSLST